MTLLIESQNCINYFGTKIMTQLYKSVLIILAFCGFFTCFNLNAETINTANPFTNPNKSIVVAQANPEFTISLAANPTTGYSWHVESYRHHLVSIVSHQFRPSTTKLVGAGGVETWTFKVQPEAFVAPHVTKIKMLYARPWDINENTKTVDFLVVTQ